MRVVSARLPSPRHEAAVFSDGRYAWVLGGEVDAPNQLSTTEIVRYSVMLDSLLALDPVSRELTVSNLRWPFTHWESAMVWNGRSGWFLGGGTLLQRYLTSIVRFDPGAGVTAQLPGTRIVRAGVWVGDAGFVFGGVTGTPLSPVVTDEIVRLEP